MYWVGQSCGIHWEGVYGCVLYQMLLILLTGATGHGVEPPVTSGKSQEENDCPCTCRCENNMGFV